MPLTPADVANKQFKIAFRGYSLDEVDGFLDEIEGELGRLLRENNDLKVGPAAAPAFSEAPVQQVPAPIAAPAPLAPGEGQEAALRTLLLAQRTADEVVAEARAEAAKIVAEAQRHFDGVEADIAARVSAAMGGVDQRKRELEQQIEDLRAFEREYRTRLKAYLEGQLRDLSTRGAPDDGGAGVPAAARSAAVGLGPAGGYGAVSPAGPPPAPVSFQPAAAAAPPAQASAQPAPFHLPAQPAPVQPPPAQSAPVQPPPAQSAPVQPPPAQAAPVQPPPAQPAPVQPPAGQPASVQPVDAPPAPAAAPPSYRPAEPLPAPPAFSPAPSVPSVVPDGPPAGPPREAEPPTLRAVPPLTSSLGPEPIGPFTIVPPTTFTEQLDDGPEPPAEQ